MNTFLLSQMEVHVSAVEREPNARTAIKHAAACDKARQAYLSSMYGFQPIKGAKIGEVVDATLDGNVATIEVRFIQGGKRRHGTFELPVTVFQKAGKRLTRTKAFQDLTGRVIPRKVVNRYKFDGYPGLTAKALLMTHYQPLRALAAKVKLLLDAPGFSVTSNQFCNAQLDLMNAWNAEDDEELQDKMTMTQVPVGQQIRLLKAAPLGDKLIVLTSMSIINRQYAAEFLGITEPAFSHFNAFHHDIFGKCYMNCRHYSLDELMLIESNPEWLSGHRKSLAPAATPIPRYPPFYCYTVVEEKVAMAFCNITRDELPKAAHVTSDNVTTYYLAELEKIRLKKLETQQQ